jgi:hypothetical protein
VISVEATLEEHSPVHLHLHHHPSHGHLQQQKSQLPYANGTTRPASPSYFPSSSNQAHHQHPKLASTSRHGSSGPGSPATHSLTLQQQQQQHRFPSYPRSSSSTSTSTFKYDDLPDAPHPRPFAPTRSSSSASAAAARGASSNNASQQHRALMQDSPAKERERSATSPVLPSPSPSVSAAATMATKQANLFASNLARSRPTSPRLVQMAASGAPTSSPTSFYEKTSDASAASTSVNLVSHSITASPPISPGLESRSYSSSAVATSLASPVVVNYSDGFASPGGAFVASAASLPAGLASPTLVPGLPLTTSGPLTPSTSAPASIPPPAIDVFSGNFDASSSNTSDTFSRSPSSKLPQINAIVSPTLPLRRKSFKIVSSSASAASSAASRARERNAGSSAKMDRTSALSSGSENSNKSSASAGSGNVTKGSEQEDTTSAASAEIDEGTPRSSNTFVDRIKSAVAAVVGSATGTATGNSSYVTSKGRQRSASVAPQTVAEEDEGPPLVEDSSNNQEEGDHDYELHLGAGDAEGEHRAVISPVNLPAKDKASQHTLAKAHSQSVYPLPQEVSNNVISVPLPSAPTRPSPAKRAQTFKREPEYESSMTLDVPGLHGDEEGEGDDEMEMEFEPTSGSSLGPGSMSASESEYSVSAGEETEAEPDAPQPP